jgi:hypothetical protein
LKATLATDAVIGAMLSPNTPGSGYVLFHHVMGQVSNSIHHTCHTESVDVAQLIYWTCNMRTDCGRSMAEPELGPTSKEEWEQCRKPLLVLPSKPEPSCDARLRCMRFWSIPIKPLMEFACKMGASFVPSAWCPMPQRT